MRQASLREVQSFDYDYEEVMAQEDMVVQWDVMSWKGDGNLLDKRIMGSLKKGAAKQVEVWSKLKEEAKRRAE